MKFHHGAKHFMRWATGEVKQEKESVKNIRLMLNGGRRIDWVIQDDWNVMNAIGGQAGELFYAKDCHGSYFRSEDVAAFVHTQLATPLEPLPTDEEALNSTAGAQLATDQQNCEAAAEPTALGSDASDVLAEEQTAAAATLESAAGVPGDL